MGTDKTHIQGLHSQGRTTTTGRIKPI